MTKRNGARRKSIPSQPFPKLRPSYLKALRSYWASDHELALAIVTQALGEDTIDENEFCYYRLWIAILALNQRTSDLKILSRHLNDQASIHSAYEDIFYSLMTLIYFELDEIEATKLMLKSLQNAKTNLYLEEVKIRMAYRQRETVPRHALSHFSEYVYDYIQCELILSYCHESNLKYATQILKVRIVEIYPNSPLLDHLELADSIQQRKWNKAAVIAKRLYAKYPNDRKHLFCMAAINHLKGKYQEAIKDINSRAYAYRDSQLQSILGSCLVAMHRSNPSMGLDVMAIKALAHAVRLFKAEGSVASFPQDQLASLKNMVTERKNNSKSKVWMVKISDKAFFRLRSHKGDSPRFVRKPLGANVRNGDICIFVYEDKIRSQIEKSWRFGALAVAVEDAQWHPMYRYQNLLKIEFVPSISIPLYINEDDKPSNLHEYSWEDERRYGVYELDDQGLAQVDEELSFYSDIYQEYKDRLGLIRNAQ